MGSELSTRSRTGIVVPSLVMVRLSRAGRAKPIILAAFVAIAWRATSLAFSALVQPKRPLSSYMMWLQENREEIVSNLPEGSNRNTDVAKTAGEQWGKLAAKNKKKFEDRAVAAK